MDEILDAFYKHKILIDIKGATNKELEELENVIGRTFVDGDHLNSLSDYSTVNYLHCRYRECTNAITYSEKPLDYGVYTKYIPKMKTVSYLKFLKPIEISEDEIESMYK